MSTPREPHILVVGTASRDTLHLPSGIVQTIGGAGLYTALAAAQAGAHVTLCAPQPQPMPPAFADAAERLHWIGPLIAETELPRLAIAHHGDGKATLLDAAWGAEQQLMDAHLPNNLSDFDAVHIAALSSAPRMLDFAHACRARGARFISAGTYFRLVQTAADIVRTLINECDMFFMNDNEARGLFGHAFTQANALPPPTKTLTFITLGANGALVCAHADPRHVPAPTAREVDPTGAGDTFCGTVLTALARGASPITAAAAGCAAASDMIQAAGPTNLLRRFAESVRRR